MARPSTLAAQIPPSIRLIQNPSSLAPGVPPDAFESSSDTTKPVSVRMEDPAPRQSITVTRSLEVESTSSAGNLTPRRPKVSVEAQAASVPAVSKIRTSRSAGVLQKPLPAAPSRISADETGGNYTMTRKPLVALGGAPPAAEKLKSGKLPPFRQSRRWNQIYNAAQPESASIGAQSDRPMSAREKSSEQQRPEPKSGGTVEAYIPADLVSRPSLASVQDNQSVIISGGLCRPLSVPTWHIVKVARASRPMSLPTKWGARGASLRRKSAIAHKRSNSVRSVTKEPSLRKGRRVRTKRAIADLRRRATFGGRATVAQEQIQEQQKVINLDVVEENQTRETRSSSLDAILNDAKKFSAEWHAGLSNDHFHEDFWNSNCQTLLGRNQSAKSNDFASGSKLGQTGVPGSIEAHVGEIISMDATDEQPVVSATPNVLQEKPRDKVISAPNPPERTSSKAGARLAQIAYASTPTCISIFNGNKDGALLNSTDVVETSDPHESDAERKRVNFRQRLASTFSSRSAKGPKHAVSTDTLAVIESDAMKSPQLSTYERIKQSTAFIAPPPKRSSGSPSGAPPQGPLPDLPSTVDEPAGTVELVKTADPHQNAKKASESATLQELPQGPRSHEPLESGKTSKRPSRRSRDTAASKNLSIQPTPDDATSKFGDPPTPSSMYSQASLESRQSSLPKASFTRHDKSRFRSARSNDVKKRFHSDRNRERRISEEDESKREEEGSAAPMPPLPPSLNNNLSIDDTINRFPPVPTSRSQSRASTNRTLSRSRAHVRQSSRASSQNRAPLTLRHRPALSNSGIKILLDEDLSTGRFRAGAMSPEPSLPGSQDGSPTRVGRARRQGSLQNASNTAKVVGRKPSLKSLKSQSGGRRTKIGSKLCGRDSGDGELDSEDEVNPQLAPPSGKIAGPLSRLKHPSDARTSSLRCDEDLEDAVFGIQLQVRKLQEEVQWTLRKQREDMQKMALIIRSHYANKGSLALADDGSLAKPRRDNLQVVTRNSKKEVRPTSDISTASAMTSATYGSTTQASATSGEASLTDPLEYEDLPALKRPDTAKSNRSLATTLHRPPPVEEVIPRGRLPEETAGLNVNHSLTTTSMMDASLEALRAMAMR